MLKKFSLATKITGAFIIVAVVALAIGLNGWRGTKQAQKAQDEMTNVHFRGANSLWTMFVYFEQVIKAERSALLRQSDGKEIEHQQKRVKEYFEKAEEGLKGYDKMKKSNEEDAIWKEVPRLWNAWRVEQAKVMAALGKGSPEEKAAAFAIASTTARDAYRKIENDMGRLIQAKAVAVDTVDKDFQSDMKTTNGIALLSVLLGVGASLGLGFFLSRSTTVALNRTTEALSDGSKQVASASGHLSSSSQGLADGSSEQAASLEETSSAMEEMSAMTKRNAESAGEAKSLVDRAGASVEKSNASMRSLVTSMAEISSMGEETGKIVKTIDEIAFQTNLLALNAAVEAARAGEAGAGFAVVADEVRNLAQRAAGAAKNTSELIEGTIKKIKDGTVLVEKTNADFGEVASAVTKVTELVAEISAASSEQSRGIDEVSKAIGQMDKVTQGNAAKAEEIASASEELSAQAVSMEDVVRGLETVVKGEGNVAARAASVRQAAPPARRKQALPVRSAPPAAGRTARASIGSGKPAGGNGSGKPSGGNGKFPPGMSPEDLIPLEEKSMAQF